MDAGKNNEPISENLIDSLVFIVQGYANHIFIDTINNDLVSYRAGWLPKPLLSNATEYERDRILEILYLYQKIPKDFLSIPEMTENELRQILNKDEDEVNDAIIKYTQSRGLVNITNSYSDELIDHIYETVPQYLNKSSGGGLDQLILDGLIITEKIGKPLKGLYLKNLYHKHHNLITQTTTLRFIGRADEVVSKCWKELGDYYKTTNSEIKEGKWM